LIENYKNFNINESIYSHFAAECLANLDGKEINWPIVSKEELIEEEVNLLSK